MIVTRLKIKNWRNFRSVDVNLRDRVFVVGPNASGKSNLMDVFRFLRDIASARGGGLQQAVRSRGGVSKIRSLAARSDPKIQIEIWLSDDPQSDSPNWRYRIGIGQETRGKRQPVLTEEKVWKGNKCIVDRPTPEDENDKERLTQTYLEQINSNANFRDLAQFLGSTTYLHLVPQLLRYSEDIQGKVLENDPYGQGFLERIAGTPEKTQKARLKKIEEALKVAVPQLEQLEFVRDETSGRPHLQALYSHWRPNAGRQREDQFSDGTLRLLGLLWSLQEGDSLLLLEEPELSLNSSIVAQLAPLLHGIQKSRKSRRRQVIVSTHSEALLSDEGIDGREVLILSPAKEGTEISVASEISEVMPLLEAGLSIADAVLPRTSPEGVARLAKL